MKAASLRFRGACEENLDQVLNDLQIYTKTIRLFALDFYAWYMTRAAPSSTIAQYMRNLEHII